MIEIRSYRRVFDLERRIYSVDHLRLNPGGVPVRGLLYLMAALMASLLVSRAPGLRGLYGVLPWYVRYVVLPGATATVLGVVRIEGRTFHLAAQALLRFWVGPKRLAGCERSPAIGTRWYSQPLLLLPDGSDSRFRRLRYTGPGAMVVSIEHERRGRILEQGRTGTARAGLRPALTMSETPNARRMERGEVIALAPGVRLVVAAGREKRRRGR